MGGYLLSADSLLLLYNWVFWGYLYNPRIPSYSVILTVILDRKKRLVWFVFDIFHTARDAFQRDYFFTE